MAGITIHDSRRNYRRSDMAKTKSVNIVDTETTWQPLELQPASYAIWEQKYCLRDRDGKAVDDGIDGSLRRVAHALADLEATPELREQWYERFLWALRHGAIPAGRIMSNAGAQAHKPATSTINCTVSDTIEDSMESILDNLKRAGITLKSGAGIGYEFSTLRPHGAYVSGAGAHTSGPLSFMDIYDRMCFTIASAGGRRGAQMATFDIGHPDVVEFIEAKRQAGRLRQFNLSLLITDDFMQAVIDDRDWPLAFPLARDEPGAATLVDAGGDGIVWRDWPIRDDYFIDDSGRVACKLYRRVRARELWNTVMRSTYDYAEPGFILIDRYNEMNNNWFCENIRATNPCGEQGLPPNGACLLGSIDLTAFVRDAFGDNAAFDWHGFREVVGVFTRMLDNVVEINGLPLPRQRDEITRKRRHGMGFLGLGSALAMLRIAYGSDESLRFTERASRELALTGWRTGLELAREKGPAPIMDEDFEISERMLEQRPEMEADGWKAGMAIKGRELHARYSRYMQRLASADSELVDQLAKTGARFTHHSSIAPTGTIALSFANNASNGIEPSFAHHYSRNVIRDGRKSKQKVDVFSRELLAYRERVNPEAMPDSEDPRKALPDYFVSAGSITPQQHVDVQAAAQRWIDSSISKTANVPTDFAFDAFNDIYLYAWRNGLKGCTTFRYNPAAFQGVLVRNEDLAGTRYRFTLADDSVIELRGDEEVEYDGEIHTAANLHEALEEGYYGKF
jgi:ribonucleoside-diphosphate reductase alpha chain